MDMKFKFKTAKFGEKDVAIDIEDLKSYLSGLIELNSETTTKEVLADVIRTLDWVKEDATA